MRIAPEEYELFKQALYEGVEHFNQKSFMDAYNTWEQRWNEETTEYAGLLKGLLKLSFACFKIKNHQHKGVELLLIGAIKELQAYPAEVYDVDLSILVSYAQSILKQNTK